MPPVSTLAALQKMYKTSYYNRDLTNLSKRRTPLYDMVTKYDDFDGASLVYPFNDGLPVGAYTSFSIGQGNPTASRFENWTLTTPKTLYGFLTIDAQSMKRSRKDIGAFMRLRQKETQELLAYMKMILGGHAFWGDGAGNLAQLSAVAGGPPLTSITVPQQDTVKFHVNQRLQFNPNRTGNAGTLRADIYRVDKINRITGVLNVTRVSGAGNDVAANDFAYLQGSYDAMPLGIQAFIPATDPGVSGVPTTLLGLDRTVDPVMRAGWRVPFQGSIEETAKYLAALMGQYINKEASALWVSRYRWFQLEQELTAQNRKVIDARATQVFGSPALLLLTPEGDVPVVADPYAPNDSMFLLDHSQIEVHHLDPLVHIVDDDGLGLLRMAADDGVEVRFRSWSENLIQKPFFCGRGAIV